MHYSVYGFSGKRWIFYRMGYDELVAVLNFVFIGWTIMGFFDYIQIHTSMVVLFSLVI